FKKGFGNHYIEAIVAHETNEDSFTFSNIYKKGIVNLNPDAALEPDNYTEQNGNSQGFTRKSNLESYFGQINYNFDNKYYLSGTLRRDGTSRFLNNKWGTFWSLGAGWVISKESFLKSSSFLSYLKLKASYGVLGDQGGVNTRVNTLTDSENYSGADYYGGQDGFYVGSLSGSIALAPLPIIDENLTWETSNQFQTGIELELFNGRIEANMDYYRKTTKNLFIDKQLASSQGDQVIRTNDGELLNQGFEFDLTGHVIKKDDFSLSLSVNGELFDNEILTMPIDDNTGIVKTINRVDDIYGHSKGSSIYDYYIREWAGVDPANGNPQWTQHWVDSNNNNAYDAGEGIDDLVTYQSENSGSTILQRKTSVYADATLKYIEDKSVIPTIRGAFRINTSFKQFSLSTQFGYSIGGYGYDFVYANLMSNGLVGNSSYHTDIRNSWKKPGDVTNVPRIYSNQNVNVSRASSRFLTSTDYLALNNIRFGYALPKTVAEQIGIGGLDLWVSGDNLFLFSERKGYNPTTSVTGQSNVYSYNPITTYTFGVRVRI
ncbi:MAG TPA: SusC/RagA family TonB-linked outer membrane protein, partial [Tenacibaculum sp.]|nr:SusC/RagA family TonB-linked outer membrane protein [Tenacibaculum sp.]